LLGTVALAVDDLGAANAPAGAVIQEFPAELFGEDRGQTVKIQLQPPGNGTTLEVRQDPLLDPGPGKEEILVGLDLVF